MNVLRQFLAIVHLNVTSLAGRMGILLTIVIGVTCAVGVLVSMLAMGAGARRQELGDVRADRVVLNSLGARFTDSSIPREEAVIIRELPGIRKGADGTPMAVFRCGMFIEGRRRVTGKRVFFPLEGVTSNITELAPEIHFTAGRMFARGLHEIITSNQCSRQFSGFEIGDSRPIRGVDWRIVGHFDQGQSQQCSVYADVDAIMSTFNRNTYTQVAVRLESPGEYARFRRAVAGNPSLHVEVRREREELEDNFRQLNGLLNFVSLFIGTIMAIGATLGAVNSLYAVVDSRKRELATLRALGFGSLAIIAATLCESVLLALPGALIGVALAWLLFNNLAASPFGYSFQLDVTPALALLGIEWALVMGLVGGILPAIRAARVPVTTALRAT
jgi:putative ABC transport system permease protein